MESLWGCRSEMEQKEPGPVSRLPGERCALSSVSGRPQALTSPTRSGLLIKKVGEGHSLRPSISCKLFQLFSQQNSSWKWEQRGETAPAARVSGKVQLTPMSSKNSEQVEGCE